MVDLEVETSAKPQADANLCRLCLKQDDFIEKSTDYPNSICQRCLYMFEAFTSFRQNIQMCELELQKRALSETPKQSSDDTQNTEVQRAGLNGCPGVFEPDEDCIITVVDPMQECESSDDDFSMESDVEDPPPPTDQQPPIKTPVSNTAPEVLTAHAEQPNPAEHGKQQELVTYTSPSLENPAMEFTKNTFLCQFCDMAFTTHAECADHESRHDPSNPFTCNFCPLRTSNRQNLIYHIKEMHDNKRPYVCALCNKGFCRRSDLKKHTIVHTGVRPFTCPVCAKSFLRNTILTKHMRIHSGIKPHVRQMCLRSFTTSGELLRRTRSHSEVKPFQCGKCSASFTSKDKLLLHEQAHYRKDSEFLMNQAKTTSTATDSGSSGDLNAVGADILHIRPKSMDLITKLQEWSLIASSNTLKCSNGHFLQLKANAETADGFQWRCYQHYINSHRKRVMCGEKKSIRTGTFFQKSHLSLFQIVSFSYLWLENVQLDSIIKQLRIAKQTAIDWSSFHREIVIYKMLSQHEKIGGPDVVVQIDESKFGRRKYHRGHRVEGQWVFGGIEEGSGRCFLVPVESRSAAVLLEIIQDWILPGTTIISDCWKAYECLDAEGFQHLTVNHSVCFVDPDTGAHTNTIEGLWKHVKAFLSPYSRKKGVFEGYLAKFMFLKNCRSLQLEPLKEFFRIAGELYNPVNTVVQQFYSGSESEEED